MKHIAAAALTLLACGDNVSTPELPPEALEYPRTCAEAAVADPSLTDGETILFIDHDASKPWSAWCAGMGSDTPRAYLTLGDHVESWSMFRAGGRAPGTDVETRFRRARIDPIRLELDTRDLTFATSTGSLRHPDGTSITSMPLGVAMSCGGSYATAQIDLVATMFAIEDTHALGGDSGASGSSLLWENDDVMEIWADGDCGWLAPGGADPMSAAGTIKLRYRM